MLNDTEQGDLKAQSGKKQTWSDKDHEKLFEFVLLNPYLIGSSPYSAATSKALYNFISPLKTFQECEIKMTNLAIMKPYDKMVDYLRKKTKLSDEWILEKKKESGYLHILHFKKELMELKESETIDHRALRMFLSSFYHKEAQFRPAKSSSPNIFTTPPFDNLNHLLIDRLSLYDSPSKVIDPNEEKIELSDKIQQQPFSTEKITKDNIEDQQNSSIICEQKQTEKLDLKTYKWNSLQKLSYLVFILKYQMELESNSQHNLTKSMVVRLGNFMQPVTFKDSRGYHTNMMDKHQTVEKIISSILNEDLFIKENVVMREIERIKHFFEKNVQKQLNAFASKSKLTLESPDEEVFEIARSLKQQLAGRMNFMSFDEQNKNLMFLKSESQQQQQQFQFKNETHPIQLPVELTIVFEVENKEINTHKIVEKIQNDEGQLLPEGKKTYQQSKGRNKQNYERQDVCIKSKKERLKEKKIEKLGKSEIQMLQNSKEKLFFEDDEFHQFNVFSENHSESEQYQSSSENDQSINQEDCENQKSENIIKKPQTKKNEIKPGRKRKLISSKSNLYLEQKKQSVVQKETYHQKQQSLNFWTLSQRMKLIAFMTVNKMAFLQTNPYENQGIREKLSKYIGTQRSSIQCKTQMDQLKEIHKYDMKNLLSKEGKKYNIDEGLLQKWKKVSDIYTNKNQITIENYCLEVGVLPMTYVVGSPNAILSQIYRLIEKGPFLEVNTLKLDKEVPKIKDQEFNKVDNYSATKFKTLKFRLKFKSKIVKQQKIMEAKITWNILYAIECNTFDFYSNV